MTVQAVMKSEFDALSARSALAKLATVVAGMTVKGAFLASVRSVSVGSASH
jgi:hypothetical protein